MGEICVVFGTRPEWLKCKPLFDNQIFVPVFIKQHKDMNIDVKSEYIIEVNEYGDDRLNNIICSLLLSDIFKKTWKAILVQGDTVVAFAGALAAFNKQIKIIHLEAGLRTHDLKNPYPEEGYRRMIDSITDIALCPCDSAAKNLINENFRGVIHIVGNTSIDVVSNYEFEPKIGKTVLITLHRRENWDIMEDLFKAIETLANRHPDYEFLFPIHPNPLFKKYIDIFEKTVVINPMTHRDMCLTLASCNCVISDSGGIQEEAAYFGKKVFCCRKTTERIDLLENHVVLTPTGLDLLNDFRIQTCLLSKATCYGIGDTSLKIKNIFETS
jgi:UDP-N-acetylglucosamine 2-epimerase (non-hydrolysing)